VLIFVLLICGTASAAMAQQGGASIRGRVVDEQQAALPGVRSTASQRGEADSCRMPRFSTSRSQAMDELGFPLVAFGGDEQQQLQRVKKSQKSGAARSSSSRIAPSLAAHRGSERSAR
jgi:hypothetical protein